METTLEPEKSSAWKRIADDLAAAIFGGTHASGANLPSAHNLATKYGVHRHTVRQAYRHLHDLGLVSVEQGRGTFVNAPRLPYRLGRRVRFRENIRASKVEARGKIVSMAQVDASPGAALAMKIEPGAPLWRIETLNSAGGRPLSFATHLIDATRFSDFPRKLEENNASLTAAFRAYRVADYERRSTRIGARAPSETEARTLRLSAGAPVLTSAAIDIDGEGKVLQIVEALFAAERMEFVVGDDQ